MITERDLREAIAECQGVRNPTSSTCIKLAAYLTILQSMQPQEEHGPEPGYSTAPAVPDSGDSEFCRKVRGRPIEDIWPEITALVDAVQVVNPRLYNSFIARL